MSVVLAGTTPEMVRCNNTQSVELVAVAEETGSVTGAVQICEDLGEKRVWKLLCDSNWTRYDAQVTCKSLNYSPNGKFPSKQGANFCFQLIKWHAFHSALC